MSTLSGSTDSPDVASELASGPGLKPVLTLTAVTAQGQPSDYRTFFTFSAPVMLPGVTLPAGFNPASLFVGRGVN